MQLCIIVNLWMKCWSQCSHKYFSFFLSIWILLCPADWQCMADYCWTVSFRTIFHKSALDPPVCAISTSSSTSAAGAAGDGVLCGTFSVCTFEMFDSEKIRMGWVSLHRLNKKFVLLSVDRENSKVEKNMNRNAQYDNKARKAYVHFWQGGLCNVEKYRYLNQYAID